MSLDRIDLEIDALMAQLRELMRRRGWLEIERQHAENAKNEGFQK